MEISSMEQRKQGRYLKAEQRRKKTRKRNIRIASVIAVICVSVLLICLFPQILPQKSVYRALRDEGYTGTQEQLIASLVGEEIAPQVLSGIELPLGSFRCEIMEEDAVIDLTITEGGAGK